jgi:exonuclease SbcD
LEGAVVRLVMEYPRQWEPLLDEAALREAAASAFEFHLVRRPQLEARLRLPADRTVSSLNSLELLGKYWEVLNTSSVEAGELQNLAEDLLKEADTPPNA